MSKRDKAIKKLIKQFGFELKKDLRKRLKKRMPLFPVYSRHCIESGRKLIIYKKGDIIIHNGQKFKCIGGK